MFKMSLNSLLKIIIIILLAVLMFRVEFAINYLKNIEIVAKEAKLEASKAAISAEGANMKAGEASASAAGCFADIQSVKSLINK